MTFTDASFLVSFFARDEHGQKAAAWWHRTNATITASRMVLFEAENSIRMLPLAGRCTRVQARWAIEHMQRAVMESLIIVRELPVKRRYPAARRLSQHYGEQRSFGAMDIIHVATAKELGAILFLSFDGKQRDLAEEEGMEVLP
jgi:predicted nucleic acid-binding protein